MQVTQPLSDAWRRTRQLLFAPFNLGTWFSFGVMFFLQSLIEGGGGNNVRMPDFGGGGRGGAGAGGAPTLKDMVDRYHALMADNGATVVIVAVGLVLFTFLLGTLFAWLGSRGQVMSIVAIARGNPAIGEAWRESKDSAWSLFKFRLLLSVIGLAVTGPLLVLGFVRFIDLVDEGVTDPGPLVSGMIPFVVVLGLVGFGFSLVGAVLRNFVAPMMWRFDLNVREGWSRFFEFAQGRWGAIFLFFVLRVLMGIGVGLAGAVLVTCTCCIGALPVLQQTLMAPWHVFERAYGLYAIESAGSEWTMLDALPDPHGGWMPPPPGGGYPPPAPPPPYADQGSPPWPGT